MSGEEDNREETLVQKRRWQKKEATDYKQTIEELKL